MTALRRVDRSRALFIVAAALTAASLALPLWSFTMSAPQYPDESLHLQVARTGLQGDIGEIGTLQKYIGVHFPSDLPELRWATRAIAALAALLLLAAFTRPAGIGRAFRLSCAGVLTVFLVLSAAAVQIRLYHVGHDRDANAPIRQMRDFTPPLVGPARVANFTVWSFPHAGGLCLLGAWALSLIAVRRGTNVKRIPPARAEHVEVYA